MSVTKPCRYFCPSRASTSCGLLDTMEFQGVAYVEAQGRCTRRSRIEARQLLQSHIIECAADGRVDALPGASNSALTLDAALTRGARALGDRDRTLKHVENLC